MEKTTVIDYKIGPEIFEKKLLLSRPFVMAIDRHQVQTKPARR